MMDMKNWRAFIGLFVMVSMFVADRTLKVRTTQGFRSDTGPLHWTVLHNYGAAGGLLSGHRVLLIVVGVAVTGFLCVLPRILKMRSLLFWIGWGLVMGGALGNLWDRAVHGYVIDMFQWPHHRDVFNAADMGIQYGLITMFISFVLASVKERRK